jgi:hypothetical protein
MASRTAAPPQKPAASAGSKRGASSAAPARPAAKSAGTRTGEAHGEGKWKADEEYRQGLKEFSETHDSEELARSAAEDLDDEDEEESGPSKISKADDDSEW